MRHVLLLPLALLLALAACGPGGEELENARIHTCELRRLERELAAEPASTALQAEYRDRLALLEAVLESSSDPTELRARLADVTCD